MSEGIVEAIVNDNGNTVYYRVTPNGREKVPIPMGTFLNWPSLSSVDITLHEHFMPDLTYGYKLYIKINDEVIVIYFDKDNGVIYDYGILSEDGSLMKIENTKYSDNRNYVSQNYFRYYSIMGVKLVIYDGKIDAYIEKAISAPVSVVFKLDILDMEHSFNVAAAEQEVRPVCTFEYKKDLIDVEVARSIGLVSEHKIC